MVTTNEQITFTTRGGIYYTDQLTFTASEGTLTCEKLVLTSDADLIDTRINQTSARHVKPVVVIVRGKV